MIAWLNCAIMALECHVPTRSKSPGHLAGAVGSILRRRGLPCPSRAVLSRLFEVMYFASLLTEEGQPITFETVFLDPSNPDPNPPLRIRPERWQYLPLGAPLPLDVPNVVKLAKATDPRSSSLVVFGSSVENLSIWGFVDQGIHHFDFANYDFGHGGDRPGVFQANIIGIGHIQVNVEFTRIGELKIDRLLSRPIDVFEHGPISDALTPAILQYVDEVNESVFDLYESFNQYEVLRIGRDWIEAICRILIRSQRYRHGGAILISPDHSRSGLNIKYDMHYTRLRDSLTQYAIAYMTNYKYYESLSHEYLDKNDEFIPTGLYLAETVSSNDINENRGSLDGVSWFISLLTRVDGLVLLDPQLVVHGFGVEITTHEAPEHLYIARDGKATIDRLVIGDYNHYGTRHRSMMRYCNMVPGSVGFVISQDGDVRAMTRSGERLIFCENIRLQYEEKRIRKRVYRKDEPSS
jgi:hypothetical protein